MDSPETRMEREEFDSRRSDVLGSWHTGSEVDLEEALSYHRNLPAGKRFPDVLAQAQSEGRILLQPRAGVPLVEDQIELLSYLEPEADLLPITIDSYTRQNRYEQAQKGIDATRKGHRDALNGFPAVNHGVEGCRKVVERVDKPVEVRHGTPDARLLAEISLAAGISSFEGGPISYNIPYAKNVSLRSSIENWRYVDRLAGIYESNGVPINREPFGPLSGTLIPPFMGHAIAIIEGILALQQGVKSITLGYGQGGNLVQDVAAMATLRTLGEEYFQDAGWEDFELTTVFHQWMGGFPREEGKALAVISLGAGVGALSDANKIIVKTPQEAAGVPTREANLEGLQASRQAVQMLEEQRAPFGQSLETEKTLIERQVRTLLDRVRELGEGDLARGTVRAFQEGVLDVPFAPSTYNAGKILPVRDNSGAIRVLEWGGVPADPELRDFTEEQITRRAENEGREPGFEMVMDDIYAIGKGRLIGRPK
ncbi:MAG: methylaspartate mutase subunit E [Candidatus Brocadiia bacterium]